MLIRPLIEFRHRFHPLHRLRQSRFIARRVLPLFDQPVFIDMHGVDWKVRVRRMRHMTYVVDNRAMEPGTVAIFRAVQALHAPRRFWDIGANVGFYSWLLMSGDPELEAVLFEPDPDNIELVEATMARGNLTRATLVPKAASAEPGTARFVMDPESGTTSHLESGGTGVKGAVVTVETTTVDAEMDRLGPPDLVKIDVEGAEDMVLAGAPRMLDEAKPVIIIECFDGLESAPMRQLAGAGYTFADGDDPRDPAGTTSNYLCLPPDAAFTLDDVRARFSGEYDRWVAGK
ncbi:MAG: FkbM family methyltransferase [Alphaproteobacteria bacterium]|nr:FkbM family methyltransferase [Alphaproteobacteria bacterium]